VARQKISQQDLNKLGIRGAKITRKSSPVPTSAEVAASEPPRPPAPVPAPQPDNSIPFASMAASSDTINQRLGAIIEQNSSMMAGMQDDLRRQMVKSPGRKPWRATVHRDRTRLIDYVDLVPLETETG